MSRVFSLASKASSVSSECVEHLQWETSDCSVSSMHVLRKRVVFLVMNVCVDDNTSVSTYLFDLNILGGAENNVSAHVDIFLSDLPARCVKIDLLEFNVKGRHNFPPNLRPLASRFVLQQFNYRCSNYR